MKKQNKTNKSYKRPPYKFNDIKKQLWLKAYKQTGSFTNACAAVKISRVTVYDALDLDVEFKEQKESVDNQIDELVESRLLALTKTHPVACFFWLCNRKPEAWKNINKVEHSGKIESPVELSDEQKKQFSKLAADITRIKTTLSKE